MMKSFTWLKKAVALPTMFLISGLFSTSVFAGAFPFHNFFTIAKHDMSMGFLETIFGRVGDLFGPNPPALLNTMFHEFNTAILVLVLFVIVYIFIVSIINTAHHGEFLGKKMDKTWVPIRVVAGALFCVPFPCGYSAIQIVMMWVIIQGVGAADSLWNTMGVYFSQKGNTLVSDSINRGNFTTKSINRSYDILKGLTAMHGHFKKTHPGSKIDDDTLEPSRQMIIKDQKRYIYYDFDNTPKNTYKYGNVAWLDPDGVNLKNGSGTDYAKAEALDKGMTNMILILNQTAKDIIYRNFDEDTSSGNVNMPNPLSTTLGYLQAKMMDVQQKQKHPKQRKSQFWDYATQGGWITAGMYYYDMAGKNNEAAKEITNLLAKVNIADPTSSGEAEINPLDWNYLKNIYDDSMGIIGVTSYSDGTKIGRNSGKWLGGVEEIIAGKGVRPIINAAIGFTKATGDPIILIQMFGNAILNSVVSFWEVIIGVLIGTGAALGVISYWAPAISSLYHVLVLLCLPAFMLMSVLFGSAVFMAFYIPLIPYIVFTFAAIGWLIAVFETMLAAPMVAIGLADPHGQHEVLGRAEPALQMLANVFLRPTLMIFGLVGGMILAKVAVGFVFKTFFLMAYNLAVPTQKLVSASGDLSFLYKSWLVKGAVADIKFIVELCLFVLINISIINRCFSLIHLVPDRVLSWLGWQAQFGQYSQTPEQELKQGFKSASGTLGKFGQQGSEGAKRLSDSMVNYGAQRGRQANDWNHGHSWRHFFGGKGGGGGSQIKQ